MADGRAPRAPEWRSGDLGALSERVTGTERQISDLANVVDRMETGLSTQIRELATVVQNQSSAFASARATNWPAVLATGAAILGVAVIIGGSTLSPIYRSIDTLLLDTRALDKDTVSKLDYKETTDLVSRLVETLRDRVKTDEDNSVSQRQHGELIARLDERDRMEQDDYKAFQGRVEDFMTYTSRNRVTTDILKDTTARTDERINTAIAAFRQMMTDVLIRPSSAGK